MNTNKVATQLHRISRFNTAKCGAKIFPTQNPRFLIRQKKGGKESRAFIVGSVWSKKRQAVGASEARLGRHQGRWWLRCIESYPGKIDSKVPPRSSGHGKELAWHVDPQFAAFAERALGRIYYGGADLGECMWAINQTRKTLDPTQWFEAWESLGDRVAAAGNACESKGHRVSAYEAYQRAVGYYYSSYLPLFGVPVDPRLQRAFEKETVCFNKAIRLAEYRVEPLEIPFEGYFLPGYYVRCLGATDETPTIIHMNGFDANVYEQYFQVSIAAARRGYNSLIFDGPGQGRNLYLHHKPLRPNWETVVSPIIDFALAKKLVHPKKIILGGWSFGGYLAPRAAAHDPRIAALVVDPGQWDQVDGLKGLLRFFGASSEQIALFPKQLDPAFVHEKEQDIRHGKYGYGIQWKLIQRGLFVEGQSNLYDLLQKMALYELSPYAKNIKCPTWSSLSQGDPAATATKQLLSAIATAAENKTICVFSEEEGAGGHCEMLARSLFHQRMFDWLDDLFKK
eukprot:g35594.t1